MSTCEENCDHVIFNDGLTSRDVGSRLRSSRNFTTPSIPIFSGSLGSLRKKVWYSRNSVTNLCIFKFKTNIPCICCKAAPAFSYPQQFLAPWYEGIMLLLLQGAVTCSMLLDLQNSCPGQYPTSSHAVSDNRGLSSPQSADGT